MMRITITYRSFTIFLLGLFISLSSFAQDSANFNNNLQSSAVFIENKGQWPDEVKYLARLNGVNIWIIQTGVVYDYFRVVADYEQSVFDSLLPHDRLTYEMEHSKVQGHVIEMEYLNANKQVVCTPSGKLETYYNYFIGNDSTKWASYVGSYDEVTIHDMYNGIDILYYFDDGFLRYDYMVHPGADISLINFQLNGNKSYRIDDKGDLQIETRFGEVIFGKIYAFQEEAGIQNAIGCKFKEKQNRAIGLALENYNKKIDLIIDPLVYSTFIGGNTGDIGSSIILDQYDNAIISGVTSSSNFPVTSGVYDTILSGSNDAFISKLNYDGSSLIFSTFIGGSKGDGGINIKTDGSGDLFLIGETYSSDFPISSFAFMKTIPAHSISLRIGFICKLNSNASSIIYSTYIGGKNEDYITSLVIDKTGSAIVGGYTESHDYPTTPGCFDASFGGSPGYDRDVFISKFNANGSSLIFSTYIGGNQEEICNAITIDSNNNVYLTGIAKENSFPITSGAYQNHNNGAWDSYVAKLNSSGTNLIYSTFLGGYFHDHANAIAVDSLGNAVVVGNTNSNDFPVTQGAYDCTINGGTDAFIIILNKTGTSLVYGSYLGGNTSDVAMDISIDSKQNIYVSGFTSSTNFPVTNNAVQTTIYGDSWHSWRDCFITKFNPDLSALMYSSYLGGSKTESLGYHEVDIFGNVFITGKTKSYDFPTTTGAFDVTHNSNSSDAFVAKINTCNNLTATIINLKDASCFRDSNGYAVVEVSGGNGGYNYHWNTNPVQMVDSAIHLPAGKFIVTVTDTVGCLSMDTVVINQPELHINQTNVGCYDGSDGFAQASILNGDPPYSFLWSNSDTLSEIDSLSAGVYKLAVIDSAACVYEDSIEITQPNDITVTITNLVDESCFGKGDGSITIDATWGIMPYRYVWSNNDSLAQISNLDSGYYSVLITDSNFCTKLEDSILVNTTFPILPEISPSKIDSVCYGAGSGIYISNYSAFDSAFWSNGNNGQYLAAIITSDSMFSLRSLDSNQCESYDSVRIFVKQKPIPEFSINDSSQCFNEQFFVIHDSSLASGDSISNYAWYLESVFLSKQQIDTLPNLQARTWNLKLTTHTTQGCSDSITKQITVHPSPITNFSINDSTQCLDSNNFDFTNLSMISDGTMSYKWIIDTTELLTFEPSNLQLKKWGKFPITLIVNSDQNCSDTANQNIYVYPMPVAAFIYLNNCVEDTMWFYDSSLVDSGKITQWFWDFKNGNTSANQNPWTIYYDTGQKSVTLISTSDFGCASDTTQYFTLESKVSAPIIERATVENDEHILVEWKKPDEGIPKSYHLERSDDGNWWDYLSDEDQSIFSFEDYMVYPDIQSYYYRLSVTDSCDYTGEYSNNGKSILLQVDTSEAYPKLVWSAYEEWAQGVAGYAVQVAGSSSLVTRDLVYQRVTSNEQLVSSFTDSLTKLNSVYYCYRVIAYRNYDSLQSVSNIVCIPTELRLFVPNSFTPNGDGINDIFLPKGIFVSEYNLQIFNRWGEKLFESDDLNKGWDGSFKNKVCQLGTYYYQIRGKGANGKSEVHNGTVQLLK